MSPQNPSSLPGSPATPSSDPLAQQHTSPLATSEITMPSPPPAEVLPTPPDTTGSSPPAESKQGVAEPEKATPGRKRKAAAGEDSSVEPITKRKRATSATAATKKKPAGVKKRSPKTPKIVVEDLDGSEKKAGAKAGERPAALTRAVQNKLGAVDAFLDMNTTPLISHSSSEEGDGSNIAIVDELDLLAAIIILRVDYQVELSSAVVSLDDVGEMVVARLDAGKVSVDFDKTCDAERAVQAKLAGRATGLEDVNFIEVEIEMLVAKRKQLVEDEEPGAGFRVYGEGVEEGETAGQSSPE